MIYQFAALLPLSIPHELLNMTLTNFGLIWNICDTDAELIGEGNKGNN